MLHKRKLFSFIFYSLFVLLSSNGVAASFSISQKDRSTYISADKNSPSEFSVITKGIAHAIKINENNFPVLKNNTSKQKLNLSDLPSSSALFCNFFYSSYSLKRINSIQHPRFYITYHRLTI
jgi:hypothetical protein